MSEKKDYNDCRHIKRPKLDTRATEEIAKEIGSNYRTLPAFEMGLFDYVYLKHGSLERNEFLRCKWAEYKKNIDQRVFAPFQFINNRDFHFYNGNIRFMPSESIYKYPEHKMKLKPGPGFDKLGQLPIPQELLMKRGTTEKCDSGKKMTGKKKHGTQKEKKEKN